MTPDEIAHARAELDRLVAQRDALHVQGASHAHHYTPFTRNELIELAVLDDEIRRIGMRLANAEAARAAG
jgi:hypothetical protein